MIPELGHGYLMPPFWPISMTMMNSLKKSSIGSGFLIAGALVFAVVVLSLIPFGPGAPGRTYGEWWNLLHVPAGAAVFVCLWRLWPYRRRALWAYVLGAGLLWGLEVLQLGVGRELEIKDGLVGMLGEGVAWMAIAAPWRLHRKIAAATAIIGLTLIPLGLVVYDSARIHRSFPMLAEFDDHLELGRWAGEGTDIDLSTLHVISPPAALSLKLSEEMPEPYPGVFTTVFPPDWSGYTQLQMHVHIETERAVFWVRADDRLDYPPYPERGQIFTHVTQGWNRLTFDLKKLLSRPDGQPLNTGHIVRFGFFLDELEEGRPVYIDDIGLQ